MTFSDTLIAELKKLDDAQIFKLLGEIVQPGKDSPFTISERLGDCLLQMLASYCGAYDDFHADDTNDTWQTTSDQEYDDARAYLDDERTLAK